MVSILFDPSANLAHVGAAMTTPSTMGSIIESLRTRLADAERDCVNRPDSDYDVGFRDAIKEVLSEITGEI